MILAQDEMADLFWASRHPLAMARPLIADQRPHLPGENEA
jgi:hypothetical protein